MFGSYFHSVDINRTRLKMFADSWVNSAPSYAAWKSTCHYQLNLYCGRKSSASDPICPHNSHFDSISLLFDPFYFSSSRDSHSFGLDVNLGFTLSLALSSFKRQVQAFREICNKKRLSKRSSNNNNEKNDEKLTIAIFK